MTNDSSNARRRRLPNRRATETIELHHGGFRYLASVGRFCDGRLGEVFISAPKTGSDMAAAARDLSIAGSAITSARARLAELGYLTLYTSIGRANEFSLPVISEVIGTAEAQAA